MANSLESADPIVTLPELGSLRGSISKTAWSGRDIYQFRGVHFAESPTGQRRFNPPVPRLPWSGIKDVSENGIPCPIWDNLRKLTPEQLEGRDWEDCLHLSVYTKNFSSKLPVMFYIHGGAFVKGSAHDHPPGYILEHDVVLVVIQYRLGPLGFLSTNTEAISGNVGILDVILALEWTQKYIHLFGGDPSRVTIFGQSAGGGIVSLLTLSPAVRDNLFHQIIVQSGAVFSYWGFNKEPIEKARRIAEAAGCSDVQNLENMNKFFMDLTLMKLLEISSTQWFSPTLGDLNGVLPDTPKRLWDNSAKSYPAMGGVTKHDGTFMLTSIYDRIGSKLEATTDATKLLDYISVGLGLRDDTGYSTVMAMPMLFTPEKLERGNFTELLPGFIDLANNAVIKTPTFRFMELNARRRPQETFLYTFDYAGEHSRFGFGHPTDHLPFNGGVHHSDDKLYIFPTVPLNEKDTEMAKRMTSFWASFAITGVPAANGVENWPSMARKLGPYLHINANCLISENFLKEFTVTIDDKTNSLIRPRKESKL